MDASIAMMPMTAKSSMSVKRIRRSAIELDRRFGLKERVSSVLSLQSDELETEAGQALLTDAVRRVEDAVIEERKWLLRTHTGSRHETDCPAGT